MPHNDLHEPDRRVDALIDYIEGDGDPDLPVWAVEALSGGLGVDVAVTQGDGPVEVLEGLSEALGGRVALAIDVEGRDAGPRIMAAVLEGFLRGLRGR
jgi:hypothetical protein